MSRVIRKSQTHSSGEAYSLLSTILATELASPSKCLWLISPWITDLTLIDNSAQTFTRVARWGARPITLVEVLTTLAASGSTIVIGTTPDAHNYRFLERLESQTEDHRLRENVKIDIDGSNALHTKSVVGDDYALVGSMNLTMNGVHMREEFLELKIDQQFVSQARMDAFERFGGIL